ncbi:MAG: tetratricopeptide repeat protein [Thermoanaerobaculia bacterium]
MRHLRLITTVALCTAIGAGVALASWYDDYDAGLDAARKGQWQAVVQKMSAAISASPNENNKARTYGAIFINYHPYYYRGIAYLNLGKYQQAISDLEKTSGPGPEDLGPLTDLLQQAKRKLAGGSTTVTTTSGGTVEPPPPPMIDRSRARAALDQAKSRIEAARARNAASSQQYQDAMNQFMQANTRLASAKSNADVDSVIAAAENVSMLADSAMPPAIATNTASTNTAVTHTVAPPPTSKTTGATQIVLGDTSRRLRQALQDYFNGDFDQAERSFRTLAGELPRNGWIWAFLGASQYSQYAFEGEDQYKNAAITSFKKAKTFGKWNDLPEKYFSKKIRKAFRENTG